VLVLALTAGFVMPASRAAASQDVGHRHDDRNGENRRRSRALDEPLDHRSPSRQPERRAQRGRREHFSFRLQLGTVRARSAATIGLANGLRPQRDAGLPGPTYEPRASLAGVALVRHPADADSDSRAGMRLGIARSSAEAWKRGGFSWVSTKCP
jgi:hypothetical protein